MIKSSPRTFALITAALASFATQAQSAQQPIAASAQLDADVPTAFVAPPDVAELHAEDLVRPPSPLRYGVVLPITVDLTETGTYEVTDDGMLVFRARIDSPGAFSLGVEFSRYEMPPGGTLFAYNESMTEVFGPYTATHRIPTGEMVIEPFPGDHIILEYSQPASETRLGSVVARSIIWDYKDIFRLERELETFADDGSGGGGGAEGCELVDVNCPEGDPFPNQKRATVRTLFGGGLCSASLINNTAQDGTRYVYTANHCGQGSTTVFRFNYQRSGCGSGSAPTNQQVSGAVLLGNDLDTDGRLLRITSTIPASFNPYFNGWSRSGANLTFGMSMHHPGGGVKKICIDTNGGGQTTASFQGIGPVKVWQMQFQTGITQGGSSGGPLFDQNNRTRGTLTGGPVNPCNVALYGRFHNFWLETNIGNFLDPLGTNQTTLDGFDPGTPPSPPTITSISPGSVVSFPNALVTLTGTNFTNATQVVVGTTVLTPPLDFQIVNNTTITFTAPTPSFLGSVAVVVANASGNSNPVALQYTAPTTLTLVGPLFMLNGQTASYQWGGTPNQITFFDAALTNTTVPFNGQSYLIPLLMLQVLNTNAVGIGQLNAPISGVPVLTTIFTQIMTVAPPGNNPATVKLSNIHSAQVVN